MSADLAEQVTQLHQTLSKMEAALDAIADAILWTDETGVIEWCNAACDRFFDRPHSAIVGVRLDALLSLAQSPSSEQIIVQNGRCFAPVCQPLQPDNPSAGQMWTFRDITEQVRVEDERQRSETERQQAEAERNNFITLVESAADMVGIADGTGRVLYMNPAGRRLLELSETEDLSDDVVMRYHTPESAALLTHEAFPIAIRDGIWVGETSLLTQSGQEIPASQVIVTHKNPDGSLKFVSTIIRDIRDRKQVEETLRRKNAILQAQQEAAIDGILVVDEHRNVVSYNQRFREIWNIPEAVMREGSSQRLQAVIAQVKNPEEFLASVESLYQNLKTVSHSEIALQDGRTLEQYSTAVKSPTGEYYGRITFYRDISDRKQSEEALRQKEAQYRSIFEAVSDALLIADPETGSMVEANPAACQMHGYSYEEFIALPPPAFIHPSALPVLQDFLTTVRSGQSFYGQGIDIHKDGSLIDVEVKGALCTYNGKTHTLAVVRDITERKKAEKTLQLSELLFRNIVENANDILFVIALDGAFTYISPNVSNVMGYKPEEMQGSFAPFIHSDDLDKCWSSIARVAETRESLSDIEYRALYKDGNYYWQVANLAHSFDADGNTQIVGVSRDNRERKEIEEALRSSEAQYRDLVQTTNSVILRWDINGVIRFINEYGLQLFGFEAEELLGHNVVGTIVPRTETSGRDLQALMHDVQHHPENHTLNENENVCKNGRRVWIAWANRPVFNGKGTLVEILSVGTDATERKRAEEALRAAKEEAEAANRAKSVFLANMSHELRTPLNAILGFTQLMERDAGLSDRQHDSLDIINRSGEHLLSLINDVLEMSKIEAGRTVLNPVSFDLHLLLKTLEELFLIRAEIKQLFLRFDIASDLPQYIFTDEGKLRQVLINLLGNAIKFTQTGGITLRCRIIENASAEVVLEFEVHDTGRGIAPEEMEGLFQPFVQTSAGSQAREGTGLGLTISRRFVRLMGGDIRVKSELGQGSTFSFRIRSEIADVSHVAIPSIRKRVLHLVPNQQTYRILVVDDRSENRQLVEQLLTTVGFETRSAVNGEVAVALWQSWQPHLILMDMRMPVMDGYEATRQIRLLEQPSQRTKIIALTASAYEEQRSTILAAGCDDLVAKPFRESLIFEKLADHLDATYLYEEKADDHPSSLILHPSSLQSMQQEWIDDLHRAALAVDRDRILQLIQQIPKQNQTLAEALTQLVEQFDFDAILDLTQAKEGR
jgi:two-component system sensor histidine kinase/response regulator